MAFNPGDSVLAYHGPMLYEAKVRRCNEATRQVLEVDANPGKEKFLVHYLRWNKKWDEWVPAGRIMPLNERTLQLQEKVNAEVIQRHKDTNKGKKGAVGPTGKHAN